MDKENQWSEINKDVADIAKKVKSKIDEEDLVEDLKDSFKKTVDKDKKLIVTIKRADLAKESADQRVDIFSPGNALDAKITELDIKMRRIKLSVKAAQKPII